MSDFKNELEQEVEFINDLISRYLPDETGLDKIYGCFGMYSFIFSCT